MPHSKTGAPREARRPSYTNSRDRSLMSYILKEPTIEQARENSAAIQGLSSSDVSAANSVASTQDPSEASTPELEYFHMRDVSANRRHSTDDKKPKKNGGSLGGVAEGEGEDPPSPPGPRTATGFPAPKSKKNKALPKKMNTVSWVGSARGGGGGAGRRRRGRRAMSGDGGRVPNSHTSLIITNTRPPPTSARLRLRRR